MGRAPSSSIEVAAPRRCRAARTVGPRCSRQARPTLFPDGPSGYLGVSRNTLRKDGGKRMASKKTRGARAGAKLGAKVAPKAGRAAGKIAWKAGKGEAKLIRRAMSAQQSKKSRYFKYAFFALVGLAIGAAIARSRRAERRVSPRPTRARPATTPPTRAARRASVARPGAAARRPAPRAPEPGGCQPHRRRARLLRPLGRTPDRRAARQTSRASAKQQDELEQRIRTNIGEDPRTAEMPRVNVEVNDGIAELRGVAPSEEAKLAAGEIAAGSRRRPRGAQSDNGKLVRLQVSGISRSQACSAGRKTDTALAACG